MKKLCDDGKYSFRLLGFWKLKYYKLLISLLMEQFLEISGYSIHLEEEFSLISYVLDCSETSD